MFTSPVIFLGFTAQPLEGIFLFSNKPKQSACVHYSLQLLLSEAQFLSFLLWEPLTSLAPQAPHPRPLQAPHRRPLPQASAFVTSSLKLSLRSSSGASFSFLDVGAVCELEDKCPPVPGSRPAHFCSRLCLPPRGDWGPLVSEAPGDF